MKKIEFKRKIGGDGGWGAGLDRLFKDHWGVLDRITEDNYFGRHDKKLISFIFPKMQKALSGAVVLMEKACSKKEGELFKDWKKKADGISKIGRNSKTLSDKVIFVDTVTQFLRETSIEGESRREQKGKKAQIKTTAVVKGLTAFIVPKILRGKARVVAGPGDISQFKKGEILITEETDSSYLPAMKKARAFVTDVGGILCHAAIVAREMKKACVVGTKKATMCFKDGDIVEVDTAKGTVCRII